ncbi:MAG: hypothetical protein ABI200_03535, partial [Gaiellales bacterium]
MPGPDGSTTDWGLTIDTLFALRATSADDDAAKNVIASLARKASTIIGPKDAGSDPSIVAKLLAASAVAGSSNGKLGGINLREATLTRFDEQGAAKAGTFGRSYALIGLARTGGAQAEHVSALLQQQCSDGYFRVDAATAGGSCDDDEGVADRDATAIAIQALITARSDTALTDSVDEPAQRALDWLVGEQQASGAFAGGVSTTSPNANSTGLAAQALEAGSVTFPGSEAGAYQAARDRAGEWVQSLIADESFTTNAGAIAYDTATLDAARGSEIADPMRDQWRRTTAQAVFALAPVPMHELG